MKKTSVGELYKPAVGESTRKWSLPAHKPTNLDSKSPASRPANATRQTKSTDLSSANTAAAATSNRLSCPATQKSNNADDDVNVRERAAMFGPRKDSSAKKSASPAKRNSVNGNGAMIQARTPGCPSKIKNMAAMFEQKS
jgi:hypothetical protein